MKKLPKKLFVIREEEGNENEFLNAQNKMEDIVPLGEPSLVGVYELKETIKAEYKLVTRKD
ncbi:hypothetical protein LCGC14_3071120 [marine sediment metagenome]|uniref:Uncharacterized protein n=1 Tax=marine sediment metagenome TaxID=412755 RepID=A0A0F8X4E6_9ZZZZ